VLTGNNPRPWTVSPAGNTRLGQRYRHVRQRVAVSTSGASQRSTRSMGNIADKQCPQNSHTHTHRHTHAHRCAHFCLTGLFSGVTPIWTGFSKRTVEYRRSKFFFTARCPSCHPTYHVEAQVIGRHSKQRVQPKKNHLQASSFLEAPNDP